MTPAAILSSPRPLTGNGAEERTGLSCGVACNSCVDCKVKGRKGSSRLRIAIGIATVGRPAVLVLTLADLRLQERGPDVIYVAFANESDLGDARLRFPRVRFLQTEMGLTCQRNRILEASAHEDILLFLDDDFCLRADYIQRMERVFTANPEVTVATGALVLDGINGPGLTLADARRALAQIAGKHDSRLKQAFNAYGCNMCLRLAPIHAHRLRFDETLPLYGWYEDVDFSRRLGLHGNIVRVEGAYGVHLGVKGGRQSGIRLGYSQIANPVYLARRGSVPWYFAITSMLSRSLKNIVRSLKPEPFVDRRGRLRGNLLGWKDLLRRRIHPQRILSL